MPRQETATQASAARPQNSTLISSSNIINEVTAPRTTRAGALPYILTAGARSKEQHTPAEQQNSTLLSPSNIIVGLNASRTTRQGLAPGTPAMRTTSKRQEVRHDPMTRTDRIARTQRTTRGRRSARKSKTSAARSRAVEEHDEENVGMDVDEHEDADVVIPTAPTEEAPVNTSTVETLKVLIESHGDTDRTAHDDSMAHQSLEKPSQEAAPAEDMASREREQEHSQANSTQNAPSSDASAAPGQRGTSVSSEDGNDRAVSAKESDEENERPTVRRRLSKVVLRLEPYHLDPDLDPYPSRSKSKSLPASAKHSQANTTQNAPSSDASAAPGQRGTSVLSENGNDRAPSAEESDEENKRPTVRRRLSKVVLRLPPEERQEYRKLASTLRRSLYRSAPSSLRPSAPSSPRPSASSSPRPSTPSPPRPSTPSSPRPSAPSPPSPRSSNVAPSQPIRTVTYPNGLDSPPLIRYTDPDTESAPLQAQDGSPYHAPFQPKNPSPLRHQVTSPLLPRLPLPPTADRPGLMLQPPSRGHSPAAEEAHVQEEPEIHQTRDLGSLVPRVGGYREGSIYRWPNLPDETLVRMRGEGLEVRGENVFRRAVVEDREENEVEDDESEDMEIDDDGGREGTDLMVESGDVDADADQADDSDVGDPENTTSEDLDAMLAGF
ncbi:MAG: hypothetical protein Q9200_000496 [Gallowayella weberi]